MTTPLDTAAEVLRDPLLLAAERDADAANRQAMAGRWDVYGAAMKARLKHLPMSPRRITQQDIDVVDAVLAVYKGVIR